MYVGLATKLNRVTLTSLLVLKSRRRCILFLATTLRTRLATIVLAMRCADCLPGILRSPDESTTSLKSAQYTHPHEILKRPLI